MQKIETGHLKQDVRKILGLLEVEGIRRRYRCHEYARRIRDYLTTDFGYTDITVNDGMVVYQASFLRRAWPASDTSRSIHERETTHSWLELVDDVIVDYHPFLAFTLNSGIENLLFVHKKDEVIGEVSYIKNGREVNVLGRPFIYYSPFNFTRLRLNQ